MSHHLRLDFGFEHFVEIINAPDGSRDIIPRGLNDPGIGMCECGSSAR
jgi:hypothetical protein